MKWAAQGRIGIGNRHHCSRIVSHLASMTQKRNQFHNRQKVTLCVEGNISSGKSISIHELTKAEGKLAMLIPGAVCLPLFAQQCFRCSTQARLSRRPTLALKSPPSNTCSSACAVARCTAGFVNALLMSSSCKFRDAANGT